MTLHYSISRTHFRFSWSSFPRERTKPQCCKAREKVFSAAAGGNTGLKSTEKQTQTKTLGSYHNVLTVTATIWAKVKHNWDGWRFFSRWSWTDSRVLHIEWERWVIHNKEKTADHTEFIMMITIYVIVEYFSSYTNITSLHPTLPFKGSRSQLFLKEK